MASDARAALERLRDEFAKFFAGDEVSTHGSEPTGRAYNQACRNHATFVGSAIDRELAALPAEQPRGVVATSEPTKIADLIAQDVCELPDRDSPEDWPEALIVTAEELRSIVVDRVSEALTAAALPDEPEPAAGALVEAAQAAWQGWAYGEDVHDPMHRLRDALAAERARQPQPDRAVEALLDAVEWLRVAFHSATHFGAPKPLAEAVEAVLRAAPKRTRKRDEP